MIFLLRRVAHLSKNNDYKNAKIILVKTIASF
jgi:hypothetical protein